ncbi:MAG: hypothetical protein IKP64_04235 [Selenomonadaceae bacterium]|nr:hypothetical protein [Selenomonadaceae bacterium]
MTDKDLVALCDHLSKDRPELVALLMKDINITLIIETLSELRRRCDKFLDNKYFVATDGDKRFFCQMSDYAIDQRNILEMVQQNLSLKMRAATEA